MATTHETPFLSCLNGQGKTSKLQVGQALASLSIPPPRKSLIGHMRDTILQTLLLRKNIDFHSLYP